MQKKVGRLVLLLTFVCGLVLTIGHMPQQIYAVGQDNVSYDHLLDKAIAEGQVSIIVGLHLPIAFQAEGDLSDEGVQSQRVDIAVLQQALTESLTGYDVEIYKTYETLPYMAVTVDAVALQVLIESPLVTAIQEDIPVPPTLASSTAIIGIPDVWDLGFEGQGQTVVILDTGIDADHTFFGNRVVAEACFSNATGAQVSLCPNGNQNQTGTGSADATIAACNDNGTNICDHGTHVAGIAAGNGNDFDGIARAADIIAIQVFSRFNDPAYCDPNPAPCVLSFSSDQLDALEYIGLTLEPDPRYEIASVNMSLGGGEHTTPCDTDMLTNAIYNLRAFGIATVIAAGNDNFRNAIAAPGCISDAVTVSATEDDDTIWEACLLGFCWGGANMHEMVDLLAPGSDVDSSVPGGSFEEFSGTSMAAPHVAGAWAIMKGINPPASVADLQRILEHTGVQVTDQRTGGTVTKPRIQLDDAIVDNIEILNVDTSAPAYAGPHDNPIKIIVEVTKPENNLASEKFGAVINSRPADVVTVYEGSDVYVLEILAPEQDANGLYDLIVSVVTDTALVAEKENQAVYYGDTNNVDVSLVIDRSGSMEYGYYGPYEYMQPAKDAATLFTNLMQDNDQLAVVSFDNVVEVPHQMASLNPASRAAAIQAIDSLTARGGTSIGGGLEEGQNQLVNNGEATHPWAIVLLSDGQENTPPYVDDVLPDIVASKTVVHTVAMGPDSDQTLLLDIASQTGGTYNYIPNPIAEQSRLQGIYNTISAAVSNQQTLLAISDIIPVGATSVKQVVVDSTISEATFSISWGNFSSAIELTLQDPNGYLIDPAVAATNNDITYVHGNNFVYYRIKSPTLISGVWDMIISGGIIPTGMNSNAMVNEGISYTLLVTGSPTGAAVTLNMYLDQASYDMGEPIKVSATLSDDQPITGAEIIAIVGPIITAGPPSQAQAAANNPILILYDDGMHGDGAANDGVYANTLEGSNTANAGVYDFQVFTSGTDNNGEAFSRVVRQSVNVGLDENSFRSNLVEFAHTIYLPAALRP